MPAAQQFSSSTWFFWFPSKVQKNGLRAIRRLELWRFGKHVSSKPLDKVSKVILVMVLASVKTCQDGMLLILFSAVHRCQKDSRDKLTSILALACSDRFHPMSSRFAHSVLNLLRLPVDLNAPNVFSFIQHHLITQPTWTGRQSIVAERLGHGEGR